MRSSGLCWKSSAPDLSQHFLLMLSEQRGRPTSAAGRLAQFDRYAGHFDRAEGRMVELHHHVARGRLRIGQRILDGIDLTARNTGLRKNAFPFRLAAFGEACL